MPETDILNPTTTWDSAIQDSMTPNYGFPRKRTNTQLHKKAVGSTPWTRETQNTGRTLTFSWLSRSWACVQRLQWYYEQYEDGYFTIIDQDGGGRNYVGRFTSEVSPVETANGTWDVQNVQFEEMPQAPMVTYPSDWNHESILFNVTNNRGDQKLAFSGAWTQAALSAAPAITLGGLARGASTSYPLSKTVMTNAGNVGEWAAYEYRGYGFQLWLVKGSEYGQADVYLDNVLLTTIDCYAATELGAVMVLQEQSISLDIHRVKIVCDHTKNGSASAYNVAWYGLQVMR